MQFLATPSQIDRTLKKLLKECKRVRWAVAWASRNAPAFELLFEYRAKIEQLTVGIHFYQTDPDFIAAFRKHPSAGFVMNPDGVFHPKLYLFEHGNGRWDCLVGSPNFTHGGFTNNDELAVRFSERDVDARRIRRDLAQTLERYRDKGRSIDAKELDAYRKIWKRQQKRLGPLSGRYGHRATKRKGARSPLDVSVFKESWPQYFKTINRHHTTRDRLAALEEAARLFKNHESFSEISDDGRRGIAGFISTKDLDWGWFGSMRAAGHFMQAINRNDPEISAALDHIPLSGEVSRRQFEAYAEVFESAVEKSGIATATRLLAFKRPDYFLCLDSKNKKRLCEDFGIAQTVGLNDYWPKVIERILDSNWWNAPEPRAGLQRRIWRRRTAFLDVRFYVPE